MSNSALLEALARLAAGDWDGAHDIAQEDESAEAAWIHALLHRIEGDHGNAAYWYRRAGQPVARGDFDTERRAIEAALRNTAPTSSGSPP